jgi:hypothetical protein
VANAEDEPDAPRLSVWQRFLAGKTSGQRFVLALGALAAAILAIGGVAVGAAKVLDQRTTVEPAAGQVQQIHDQQRSADDFVRMLLRVADTGAPVQLDHQVLARRGPGGEYRLGYGCGSAGCSFVRLEAPATQPDGIAGGAWYQGCWSVVKDGAGYGADHLDLELYRQGDTCPR